MDISCFDEFSITFDGTQSLAEAEAIVIQIVTMEWDILELVVHISLLGHHLIGTILAHHIVSTIVGRCGFF